MKSILHKIGNVPIYLAGFSAGILAVGYVLPRIAACRYDDVFNEWSCAQTWAASAMGIVDAVLLSVALPVLIIAIIIIVFRSLFSA